MVKEPWFERWGVVGYRPVNRKGLITLMSMGLGFFLFGALSLYPQSNVSSLIWATLAVLVAIVGHWIIFSHMSDPNWRR